MQELKSFGKILDPMLGKEMALGSSCSLMSSSDDAVVRFWWWGGRRTWGSPPRLKEGRK